LWQLQSYLRLSRDVFSAACQSLADQETLRWKWEWPAFLTAVQSLESQRIPKIKNYRGGSLKLLYKVCPPDAHFISLDLDGGGFGGGYSEKDVNRFKERLRLSQRIDWLRMDSYSAGRRQAVNHLPGDS
jgi:hypothetical protein